MSKFEIGDRVEVIGFDYFILDDLYDRSGQVGYVANATGSVYRVVFEDGKSWLFIEEELKRLDGAIKLKEGTKIEYTRNYTLTINEDGGAVDEDGILILGRSDLEEAVGMFRVVDQ